ncbi:KH domain-containing protein [Candidatus Pacearchaeota archaeon]|nr:KH domain-containing protein [Candidatus Pacearchaeota archaeon]
MKTIDMQQMRYLNMFSKVTQVPTSSCFVYNNTIFFSVSKNQISKAIGENGRNIKRMSEIFGKRVRVVSKPEGVSDSKKFIESIVNPLRFKELEVRDNEIVITAGSQSKAALIGRFKRRLEELQDISKEYFGMDVKII